MLRDGNYSTLSALSCLGFIRSPTEYYFELLRMLLMFYERGVYFKNELIEAAITVQSTSYSTSNSPTIKRVRMTSPLQTLL